MLIYTNPDHKANPIHRKFFSLGQAESVLEPDSLGGLRAANIQ